MMASAVMQAKGIQEVIGKLHRAAHVTGANFSRALKRAGLFIQAESQRIVPIDLGNLKGSAFTRAEGEGFGTEVIVGYTADYAIYVHENLEAQHAPGKSAKFLEIPLRENIDLIMANIARDAKL